MIILALKQLEPHQAWVWVETFLRPLLLFGV